MHCIIGRFGNVTLPRVDKKQNKTKTKGKNRNGHQQLTKLLFYVSQLLYLPCMLLKSPWILNTLFSFFFLVLVFFPLIFQFWDHSEQHISQSTRLLATGGHFCIIKTEALASPSGSPIYFLESKFNVRKNVVLSLIMYVFITPNFVNDKKKGR